MESDVVTASPAPASEPAALQAEQLIVRYGTVTAVDHVSLTVRQGEFVALLGPSGCGKTTILRTIAGLNQLDAGTIHIDGKPMADPRTHIQPEKRPLNMVFQSYAIWPHLSVRENVGYGVRGSGVRGRRLKERVDDTLAAVGLLHYADRYGTELSGGQQQRVAVARALATRPYLMLYDEPLSNLDAGLRERVREQIVDLHHRFDTTTIYVTHDQAEALSMADRVILMNAGKIEQASGPRTLYHRPESEFAARFTGPINAMRGTVTAVGHDYAEIELTDSPGRTFRLASPARLPQSVGAIGQVAIRPEYFELSSKESAVEVRGNVQGNCFDGVVTRAAFVGSRIQCVVASGASDLSVEVSGIREIGEGEAVSLWIDPSRAIWIEDAANTDTSTNGS